MGFLGKARKMIGGGAVEPPKPQYYQVACTEGHVVRGERTEGYQALRCPHCGDGIFILPRSPLPLPPPPTSSRKSPSPSRRAVPDAFYEEEIELTEAPAQEELDEIQWIDPDAVVRPPGDAPQVPFDPSLGLEESSAEHSGPDDDSAERPSAPASRPRSKPTRS